MIFPLRTMTFPLPGKPLAFAISLNLKARYMDGRSQENYSGTGKLLFIRIGRIES